MIKKIFQVFISVADKQGEKLAMTEIHSCQDSVEGAELLGDRAPRGGSG